MRSAPRAACYTINKLQGSGTPFTGQWIKLGSTSLQNSASGPFGAEARRPRLRLPQYRPWESSKWTSPCSPDVPLPARCGAAVTLNRPCAVLRTAGTKPILWPIELPGARQAFRGVGAAGHRQPAVRPDSPGRWAGSPGGSRCARGWELTLPAMSSRMWGGRAVPARRGHGWPGFAGALAAGGRRSWIRRYCYRHGCRCVLWCSAGIFEKGSSGGRRIQAERAARNGAWGKLDPGARGRHNEGLVAPDTELHLGQEDL